MGIDFLVSSVFFFLLSEVEEEEREGDNSFLTKYEIDGCDCLFFFIINFLKLFKDEENDDERSRVRTVRTRNCFSYFFSSVEMRKFSCTLRERENEREREICDDERKFSVL